MQSIVLTCELVTGNRNLSVGPLNGVPFFFFKSLICNEVAPISPTKMDTSPKNGSPTVPRERLLKPTWMQKDTLEVRERRRYISEQEPGRTHLYLWWGCQFYPNGRQLHLFCAHQEFWMAVLMLDLCLGTLILKLDLQWVHSECQLVSSLNHSYLKEGISRKCPWRSFISARGERRKISI